MTYGSGSFPSICFHEGALRLLLQDYAELRLYREDTLTHTISLPDHSNAVAVIASMDGELWLAYRALADGILVRTSNGETVTFGRPGGNHAIQLADGYVWWLEGSGCWRAPVRNPSAVEPVNDRNVGTGIVAIRNGQPVYWDDVRASQPGMLQPSFAGSLCAGEGLTGGALVRDLSNGRELLLWPGWEAFEPQITLAPDGSCVVATHSESNPRREVRTERVRVADLREPQPIPTPTPSPSPVPMPPDPAPEEPPVSEPVAVPDHSTLSREQWDAHQMSARQLAAYSDGGKPAILRLQAHYFARLTPIVQRVLPNGWKVKWERYRNPVPGTEWNWLPDQFLLVDPNGFVHAVKVIVGASEEEHRAHNISEPDENGQRRFRWVLGAPSWSELSINGREGGSLINVTVDDPLMDPLPESALGPSPFATAEPSPAPAPAPSDPTPPASQPPPAPAPDTTLAPLLLKILVEQLEQHTAQHEAILSELVALRSAQGEQTAALKSSIADLQKQVRDGVKIRF